MASKIVPTVFVTSSHGKNNVKLLSLRKDGATHYIKEVEVSTGLTLNNERDYLFGDNSDIIATDSQKNTVYIFAKQYGVANIEQFAVRLSEHFLNKYPKVVATKIGIEEYPWKRVEINGDKHVHAFQFEPTCSHVCEVTQERNGKPLVQSGIRGLRVLKTTQSAFKDFTRDEYRTLPDTDDRIFSTVVTANWWYNTAEGFCFDRAWETVKNIVLEVFAGPADKGIFSASVQNTLYLIARSSLAAIPQLEKMELEFPNKHYFDVDFSRFPQIEFTGCETQVYTPVDKPSGNIHAVVQRSQTSKL